MIRNYADHAANERTFLSWVRTAVAIVGFGLAAARLDQKVPSLWSELTLLSAGVLTILIAYLRMKYLRQRISSGDELDDGGTLADMLLIVLVVALFAMLAAFAMHVLL